MNRKSMASVLVGAAFLGVGLPVAFSWQDSVIPGSSEDVPAVLPLTAIVRDFRPYNASGGHADFERYSGSGRVGLLAAQLGEDGKPVLASLTGRSIERPAVDSQGRNINPALVNQELGDNPGSYPDATQPMISSPESFAQWYKDVPGVNLSRQVELSLVRNATTGMYEFSSASQAPYSERGGFFPVDGELYGNQGSSGHNFGFTTEIVTEFTYKADNADVFSFSGDDDVWVFINGQMVIDLGGVHSPLSQTVDLARLGLEDGKTYPLQVFHAERRTSGSNFQMMTTLVLRKVSAPMTTAMFD